VVLASKICGSLAVSAPVEMLEVDFMSSEEAYMDAFLFYTEWPFKVTKLSTDHCFIRDNISISQLAKRYNKTQSTIHAVRI
jgi:hypothetical protein